MSFPPVPPQIKSIAHVLKVADEHQSRNIIVTYWARMYAVQTSMKLIPGKKPPEVTQLLLALMDWLEKTKKENSELEGIHNDTVAQALIEDYALQLFNYADNQDRQEIFNKNMIKAFYTAGILMDILEQFGQLSDDLLNKRKYAKWKAAYIHNCLKTGDTPTSGGPDEYLNNVIDTTKQADDDNNEENVAVNPPPPTPPASTSLDQPPTPQNPPLSPFFPPPSANNFPGPAAPAPASSPVTPVVPPQNNPLMPPPQTPPISQQPPTTHLLPSSGTPAPNLNLEAIHKAQKYCKYATSALNYDDVKTAIENLHKALNLLQCGKEC